MSTSRDTKASVEAGSIEAIGIEAPLETPAARTISPYRWVILLLCLLVMATSFTIRIAWSSASTAASQDLGLNPTMLGSFITAFFTGYVITNAMSGFAADRFGAKTMIVCALVPLAIFVAAFGLAAGYVAGLSIQMGMGLMAGSNFSATTKLAAAWFPKEERGRAFGILSTASSLALIFSNSVFPSVIDRTSWRMLYFGLGGGVLIVAVLCLLLVRESPTAPRTLVGAQPRTRLWHTVREFVADRSYVFLGLTWLGGLWGTWGITFWANALMVKGHGLTNHAAGSVMALLGLGGLVAKPLYGWLSDFLPVRRKMMLLPCFFGFAVMLLIFGSAQTEAQFLLLAPILGVFTFAYSPLTSAMLTEIIGDRNVGGAAGLMNAFTQSGVIIAPLAVGFVFQTTGSFLFAFAALAFGPMLAFVATCFIIEAPRKKNFKSV